MMGRGDSPAALRASSLSTACRTVTPWATTSRKMRRLAWQYATDDGLVTPTSTAALTASSCSRREETCTLQRVLVCRYHDVAPQAVSLAPQ